MKYFLMILSVAGILFSSQAFANDEEVTDPCGMEKGLLAEWIKFKYLPGTAGNKAYKSSAEATKECLKKNVEHDYYCGKSPTPDDCRERMLESLENYNFNAITNKR